MAERQYHVDGGATFNQVRAELALRERSKELECVYRLVHIIGEHPAGGDEMFDAIANLLPPAWLYPEITWARLRIHEREYVSGVPGVAVAAMQTPLTADGRVVGAIEVGYRAARPSQFEGPFLKEERRLLDAVAQIVSLLIEREHHRTT